MVGKDSSDEQGMSVNLAAVLALLTLLGGVLLVTHKLSSDRPVAPPGVANKEISEQKIDTRLWEDPFGQANRTPQTTTASLYGHVAGEITNSENKDFRLLAIMVPGGPASEDRERRMRSRLAIVSALAESAYAPRHAAHIGIEKMAWPDSLKLAAEIDKITHLANSIANITNEINTFAKDLVNGELGNPLTNRMVFAFEWYDREYYVQHREGRSTNSKPVLVVWLDEDQFDDYPIQRLDLFFRTLGGTNLDSWTNNLGTSSNNLALIGPGRSDTLKAMFPNEFDASRTSTGDTWATDLNRQISLFLATPRGMDEVLVKTNSYREEAPRQALLARLGGVFRSARNFAATDSDLTRGVLDELEKRGVDLRKTNEHHLVLIEGWDEYFGRMLSAAYAAQMGVRQVSGINQSTFWEDYHNGTSTGPTNLHTFLYLSGLDGQGLSSEPKNDSPQDRTAVRPRGGDSTKESPTQWTPDVNRAEGPAQYDYLGRLAGRIEDLNAELLQTGQGKVSAIGIEGGDVYDTLLILQALRWRFPEAIFFATDLDARFWDPLEWPWSRNLVVVSGYGLALNEAFQRQTAPFRDSLQTAVYAAALAALGNTNIPVLTGKFPVRQFEIGRNGPVDLSTANNESGQQLHPDPKRWPGVKVWFKQASRFWGLLAILIGGLLLAITMSGNFRRLTVYWRRFLAEPLWLREEDIGGLDGFIEIVNRLACPREKADAKADPNNKPMAADPQRDWLYKSIRDLIKRADNELDKDFEEQSVAGIFTESDILDPDKLVGILQLEDKILEQGNTDKKPARTDLGQSLRNELPGITKAGLPKWDSKSGKRSDQAALLEDVIKALRRIFKTVNLHKLAKIPDLKGPMVLWRKNRELLNEYFGHTFKSPVSVFDLFFPESKEEPRDCDQELKEVCAALKDPKRRESLHPVMLKILDAWNARLLKGFQDEQVQPACDCKHGVEAPQRLIPPVKNGADLRQLKNNRREADKLIEKLLNDDAGDKCPCVHGESEESFDFKKAADAARRASWDMFKLSSMRLCCVGIITSLMIGFGAWMFHVNLQATASWPWEVSGASVWPSNWLYFTSVALGFLFISESFFRLRTTMLQTTRQCRLDYCQKWEHKSYLPPSEWQVSKSLWWRIHGILHPSSNEPVAVVYADDAWGTYQLQGRGWHRFFRTLFFTLAYLPLILGVHQLALGHPYSPLLRAPAGDWYSPLIWTAFALFLYLSFWTIDAAFLCRWFILRISQGPTLYSRATRQYFSRQRGQVPYHVLSEWIDVSVIAQITERVGKLIYFPAGLFLLIVLANNSLLYYFPWPPIYYVLAVCNFGVAAASIVVLQRAARKARERSVEALEQKLNQLKAGAVANQAQKKQHDINETEELLREIGSLKKGAFGGFWSNPVVGALLLPSGGTALIEIIRYLMK